MITILNILGLLWAAVAVVAMVAILTMGPPTTWFEWLAFAITCSFGFKLLLVEDRDA